MMKLEEGIERDRPEMSTRNVKEGGDNDTSKGARN
jgi:hypothetical protein